MTKATLLSTHTNIQTHTLTANLNAVQVPIWPPLSSSSAQSLLYSVCATSTGTWLAETYAVIHKTLLQWRIFLLDMIKV